MGAETVVGAECLSDFEVGDSGSHGHWTEHEMTFDLRAKGLFSGTFKHKQEERITANLQQNKNDQESAIRSINNQ